MIERLVETLRALAAPGATTVPHADRADCADALRLELDCPQMALTTEQREALHRLDDLLETEGSSDAAVSDAARHAVRALGV